MTINSTLNSLHRGQALAVSIPPSDSKYLAWIGVYPLDLARETTRELLRNHGQAVPLPNVKVYRIRRIEVDRILIEQDASIAESELQNKSNCFVFGDDELAEKLTELGVQLEHLTLPYKSNYPI
jgi:hypothetical protein